MLSTSGPSPDPEATGHGVQQAGGVDPSATTPRVVTVFRSRLRPGAPSAGYPELADRLEARARAMPGFVDFKTFSAPDGERVSVVTFDGWDNHRAWRDDPEHRAGQERGRTDYYETYAISVCEERHRSDFDARSPGAAP